jgi:hypothetical protein
MANHPYIHVKGFRPATSVELRHHYAEQQRFADQCLRPDGFVEVVPLAGESLHAAMNRVAEAAQRIIAEQKAHLARALKDDGAIDMVNINGVYMTPEDARKCTR